MISNSFAISASGMSANKEWLEITANNIANINTTQTREGGPYKRQSAVFENMLNGGVEVTKINQDPSVNAVYDPKHPDADADGMVKMPSVNMAAEMVNMMTAQRGYQANVTSFNESKKMAEKTYEIGRG